jgi:hypothetical protein
MKLCKSAALAVVLAVACGRGDVTGPNDRDALMRDRTVMAIGVDSTSGASIETNKDDYMPGEVVHLVGRGWSPNETVNLHMTEEPNTHADVDTNVVADSAGEFSIHFYDVQPHDLGVTFTLTATGGSSGSVAVATFTDGQPNSFTVTVTQSPASATSPGSATYTIRVNYTGTDATCTATMGAIAGTSPAWPALPPGTFSFSPASVVGRGPGGAGGTAVNPETELTIAIPAGMVPDTYKFKVTATRAPQTGDNCQGSGTSTSEDINLVVGGVTATSMTLDDSPDSPTTIGTGVTFTAGLTPNTATGSVAFYEFTGTESCTALGSATPLQTVAVSSGSAAYGPVTMTVGSHTITACYLPDAGFQASSQSVTHVVQPAGSSIAVTTSKDPAYYGDNITFTATLTVGAGQNPDGGTVNFAYNATSCDPNTGTITGGTSLGAGSATIASGAASVTASLPVGVYQIMACYGGNGTTITGAQGTYADQDVLPAVTETALVSSPDPSVFGSPVTFTATVTLETNKGAGSPTGSVAFYLGNACSGTPLGTDASATTSTNQSVFSLTVSTALLNVAGSAHAIRACFDNTDGDFADSHGDDTHTVTAVQTTLVLSVSPTAQQYSDKVVLDVTVTPYEVTGPEPDVPLTGDVYFYIGTAIKVCGTSAPSGHVASEPVDDADNGVVADTVTLDQASSTTDYKVTACFYADDDNFTDASDSRDLKINKEDATVYDITATSPLLINTTGGTVSFKVRETNGSKATEKNLAAQIPDLVEAGDISNAGVQITVKGVLNNSNTISLTCSGPTSNGSSGYAEILTVSCTFPAVLIADTYEVDIDVTGNYYQGEGAAIIQVNDPSSGFATGGGWFRYTEPNGDKVNFGFMAKATVNNKKTVYQGALLIIRHKSNGDVIKVKSNMFEGYSIQAPTNANPCGSVSFSGKATYSVNGSSQGNFVFAGYGLDCGEPGTSDKFGVHLAGPSTNEINTAATASGVGTFAKTLAGGNIQVPQPSRR